MKLLLLSLVISAYGTIVPKGNKRLDYGYDECVDIDPKCDSYLDFCDQENIQLLCKVTCQIGECKTTTTKTTTTTTTTSTTTSTTTTTTASTTSTTKHNYTAY